MIIIGIIAIILLFWYMERITNNIHSTNLLLRDLNNNLSDVICPLIEEINNKLNDNK